MIHHFPHEGEADRDTSEKACAADLVTEMREKHGWLKGSFRVFVGDSPVDLNNHFDSHRAIGDGAIVTLIDDTWAT